MSDETDKISVEIKKLVTLIINRQKENPRYDYQSNEQKQIDTLVYEGIWVK